MNEDKQGWNKFRRIKLDRRRLNRHAKRIEAATIRHANKFLRRRLENARLVRREITVWLVLVGVIVAALGAQLLWGQQYFMAQSYASGGSYVEGTLGPIGTLNPLYASSSAEASVGRLLFSSLYNYDEYGALHRDLVVSSTIDESQSVYTVKIRDNAKWHDGRDLTAADVVYTVNLMKDPATRSPLRVNWLDVSASAIDKYTIEFKLPVSYAAFSHALTFPILPEHLLADISPAALRESPFSSSPIGSGPFTFQLLQSTDAVRNLKAVHLVANENYYGGRPNLDRFEVQAYGTEEDMVRALKVGEISGAADVPVTQVNEIKNSAYIKTPQSLASGVYLLINNSNSVLQDVKVRKALQVGTDSNDVRRRVGEDLVPLDLPFAKDQLTGDSVPKAPEPNRQQAAKLLDEAGWTQKGAMRSKNGEPLRITVTTTKNSEYQATLDVIREQWLKLGIAVEANVIDTSLPSSTFVQSVLQQRNFDILLYELSIGADPDVYAYWHSSQLGQTGYNFTNYSNKTADANLASARSRLEPELRNVKYVQFARQWIEDVPAIGLYQPVLEYVSSKNARTVNPDARLITPTDRYANILEWSINQESVYKTP